MNEVELALARIADNLDGRFAELTSLRLLVLTQVGKRLEFSMVRTAIPMIYAQWEGYVKEVCQLYLEHVESVVKRCLDLHPAMLGYLWTPFLQRMASGLNAQSKTALAYDVVKSLEQTVIFRNAEKAINTKSNLTYEVLEEIAASLCLDISGLAGWKRHLNALVHLRNSIAHGARPTSLRLEDFDQHAEAIRGLMQDFERTIFAALRMRAFSSG